MARHDADSPLANAACHRVSCAHSGELVTLTVSGTSTGNLRISNLTLQFQPLSCVSLSCNVAGVSYGPDNMDELGQAVVDPGDQGACVCVYEVTTADFEQGPRDLTATLGGVTIKGPISTTKSVWFNPVVSTDFSVTVDVAGCNNATAGAHTAQHVALGAISCCKGIGAPVPSACLASHHHFGMSNPTHLSTEGTSVFCSLHGMQHWQHERQPGRLV
jgi:hypothetical protein